MPTTSSPNEPTEGPGGMSVYDLDGLHVGHVRKDEEVEAVSEDLARVVIHLSDDARRALDTRLPDIDVEATWLEAPAHGDHLTLDRPLREALREQGYEV